MALAAVEAASAVAAQAVDGSAKMVKEKMIDMKYPNWIYKFLSEQEINSVSETVKKAESKTSGEIVPVIVRRSSSVRHLPTLLTCLLLILFFLLNGFNFLDHEFKIYFSNIFAVIGPYVALSILTGVFYLISLKLTCSKCIQRLLISEEEMSTQVGERALLEFYLNHVTKTEFKTGILIFISLMERQTVVLGDEAISKKIPKETWQEIVGLIVNAVKENKTAEGLKTAITKCGEILSQHFPSQPKNPDELENHLVIKD